MITAGRPPHLASYSVVSERYEPMIGLLSIARQFSLSRLLTLVMIVIDHGRSFAAKKPISRQDLEDFRILSDPESATLSLELFQG